MHSYKLNNSYTIYVYHSYVNDCIKACKSTKLKASPVKYTSESKDVLIPFPINASVQHKLWGTGYLVSKEANGIMTIAFKNKTARFIYPDAFTKGHLIKYGGVQA